MYFSEVYEQSFWMMLHGNKTPKPTIVYSDMIEIHDLDLGVLTKKEKESRTSAKLTRALTVFGNNRSCHQLSTIVYWLAGTEAAMWTKVGAKDLLEPNSLGSHSTLAINLHAHFPYATTVPV